MADMLIALRILFISLPMWALMFTLNTVLIVIGWLVVPVAVICGAYKERKSKYYDSQILAFTWPWMYLWGNEEDGIAAGIQYKDMGSVGWQIIYWSCLRNPVNNLRFVKWLSCNIEYDCVRFIGTYGDVLSREEAINMIGIGRQGSTIDAYDSKTKHWFFAWHGLYSCWYWQFVLFGKLRRLWIGWKVYPTDIYGVTEYRKYGAGFCTQFKAVK